MRVKIAGRVYNMPKEKYLNLLETAKEQVVKGIYGIENAKGAELLCIPCESMTRLKKIKRSYRKQGYKVHYKT